MEERKFLIGSDNNSIYICSLEYSEKEGSFTETLPQLAISVVEEKSRSIMDIRILHTKHKDQR